jgi:inactivated superfamily I helicase
MEDKDITKELESLNPEERAKRLKDIEEKLKKELEELKVISQKTEEELREKENKKLLEIIPEEKPFNIEELFFTDRTLEEHVRGSEKEKTQDSAGVKYLIDDLESRRAVREIMEEVYETRKIVENKIIKYNPSLGEQLKERVNKLAETIKNIYTRKI